MEGFKIVLLCIVSAVVYGILHDQVTARVCVEYFTIGHPQVFQTESPTLLALGWGIIATWWSGLLVGIALAFTSPYVSLLLAATVAGLFWNMGSYLILIHFVAPPLLGLLVAFLFRSFSREQQFLILMSTLAVSELVRTVVYCVVGNGWLYISSDSETQGVMLFIPILPALQKS